jgi:hypothetical protein
MREEASMSTERKPIQVEVGGLVGIIWFIGYLFTLAFAQLVWWQALFALLIWPYYLGLAAR